jgi:hypothetical protein
VNYDEWSDTCDTLHGHTQVLGKLAVALAPPEPQLQHAALRLTVRGWESAPMPAPDRSGALVAGLDLHAHEAFAEWSDGRRERIPLTPDRSVGEVARALVAATGTEIDPTPQEVWWTVPLDEDEDHATYDVAAVERYFSDATRAALVLAEFRAPYRGRDTPVNAWWGSFDLAVNLFSGEGALPPSDDFIMRNAMDAQEVAVGWWPGHPDYPRAAFYGYAHPAVEGLADAELSPAAARWDEALGEFVLDQDDAERTGDAHGAVLGFARSLFRHACSVCGWNPELPASAEGSPAPLR